MPGYSRMDLMKMSDEDLRKVLKDEGDNLPGYTVSMIVEELKNRMEMEEQGKGGPAEGLSEDGLFEEDFENSENEESLSDADTEGSKSAEENEEDGENKEDEKDEENEEDEENLTEEEKLQKEMKRLEEQQKDRKKTLIIASIAAGIAALAVIGLILYLYFDGQLQF